jgi:hypothetical protein
VSQFVGTMIPSRVEMKEGSPNEGKKQSQNKAQSN